MSRWKWLTLAAIGYAAALIAALRYPYPLLFWAGFGAFSAGAFGFGASFDDQREWGN